MSARVGGFWGNYFTEICSGSEAGSYLRLIDFVYHSPLGLRVIKKKKGRGSSRERKGVVPSQRLQCKHPNFHASIVSPLILAPSIESGRHEFGSHHGASPTHVVGE